VAENLAKAAGLHSSLSQALQVMVGGTGTTVAVSVHEHELPEASVATQVASTPLQLQLVAMDTVPSAF